MVFVETEQEYSSLRNTLYCEDVLLIPIYSDIYSHPIKNRISFLYFYGLENGREYIVSYNHNDVIKFQMPIESLLKESNRLFVYNKKRFMYHYQSDKLIDIDLIQYFKSNVSLVTEASDTRAHNFLYRQMAKYSNTNDVVPITKHYEKCERIRNEFLKVYDTFEQTDSFNSYNTTLIDNLWDIENNGLFVDYLKFLEVFGQNGLENNMTYSEYNIYTTTSRPSNRHSGINYAALNKDDETRSSFVSRHKKNGLLIQMDYDAYHLRLIAEVIGYKFPNNISIHEYLGKQYFGVDELTEEQYNQSKSISFRQLYGGVEDKYNHIPYFQQVTQFIENTWQRFRVGGYIKTALFDRKLDKSFFTDINKNKLWNYFLQNLETERNMLVLDKVRTYTKKLNTKVILYTYDSILLDYDIREGKQILEDIKEIMESGEYPVSISYGSDYHNMVDTDLLKS